MLRSDRTVWCFGFGGDGQLGDGMMLDRSSPVRAGTLTAITDVDVGALSSYAIDTSGRLWAWGANDRYDLGDGTTVEPVSPKQITGMPAADELSAGESHACIRSGGDVYCWGWNADGQVGVGGTTDQHTPALVLSNAIQISAGGRNTCAIKTDHSVWCWGENLFGNCGLGNTNSPQTTPAQIPGFTADEVSVGGHFACARPGDGSVRCWGRNDMGQLGTTPLGDQSSPFAVPGITNAIGLGRALGGHRACARIGDGTTSCWGETMYGVVTPPPPARLPPVPPARVAEFDGATLIAAGSGFSCVRTPDGTLACAGENVLGQLGDGSTTSRNVLAPTLLACP